MARRRALKLVESVAALEIISSKGKEFLKKYRNYADLISFASSMSEEKPFITKVTSIYLNVLVAFSILFIFLNVLVVFYILFIFLFRCDLPISYENPVTYYISSC